MIFVPTTPAVRGRTSRPGWLSGLPGSRHSGGRITSAHDLPSRVLNDIGLSVDVLDALLRRRR